MSLATNYIVVESIDHLQQILRTSAHILPRGGGSKPALTAATNDATPLDLRSLTGILEYEPGEYTITARAGTPVAELQAALAENGQYLPFDPPLVVAGATLGGTVAAGLSGSGRYRYGGVRDFLIGVRFVDGQGRDVRGGGKVVKNAAGFDLPKLMVGSLGCFGVLTEVTFKVFPKPPAFGSLHVIYPTLGEAVTAMNRIASAQLDLEALDIAVIDGAYELWVRLGGWASVLPERIGQLRAILGAGDEASGPGEAAAWHAVQEFAWSPPGWALVKVATNIAQLPALDRQLTSTQAQCRYAVGGNLTWVAWPRSLADLDGQLRTQGLAGLVLRGDTANPWIGHPIHNPFAQRIKQALDPDNRFS